MIAILDNITNQQVIGRVQVSNATVTEELNGIYEAQFQVAVDEKRYGELEVGGIVKINTSMGEQMFRIYEISKPINLVSTVKCEHISYDLLKVAVLPFSATGSAAACTALVNAIVGGTYPFTMTTDIANSSSTVTNAIPRRFREVLGGYDGSFLDVFRGEYEWDNLTVKMLARRGSDQGVTIAYGKNLTDFKQEENNEAVFTAVLGYAVVNDVTYYGDVYHKVSATYPKIKIVDFSENYDVDDVPTTAELTTLATNYATNNDIEVPKVSMDVKFVDLSKTEEYKDYAVLEDVYLGDTVYIRFDKLGVTASSRVIKTEWDVNAGRYTSITLGSYKSNMSTVLNTIQEETAESQESAVGFLQSELSTMASLIINGLGLHVTKVRSGSGYIYYLHNGETLATSDTWYVMSANGILVSTDYGQTWNAGFDSQGNAVLNSLATISLRALEIYGSRITFGDENDKYITAGVYTDSNNDPVGVSFDGTGYARFQPHEEFQVVNLNSNDIVKNEFRMDTVGSVSSTRDSDADILLANYGGDTYNYLANQFRMTNRPESNRATEMSMTNKAHGNLGNGNEIILRSETSSLLETDSFLTLKNYHGASSDGNYIMLSSWESDGVSNNVTITNPRPNASSTAEANGLYFFADSSKMDYDLRGGNLLGGSGFGSQIIGSSSSSANTITAKVNDSSGNAITQIIMNSSGVLNLVASSLRVNSVTPFTHVSATSGSVSCGANTTGSTTVSITIPTGYKGATVANLKSNGAVVPAYTTAAVFGMTGTNTLTIWWQNGTNSAVTCTFTIELLCVVNV